MIEWTSGDFDKHGPKLIKAYRRLVKSVDFYQQMSLKFEPDLEAWRELWNAGVLRAVEGTCKGVFGEQLAAVYVYAVAPVPGNPKLKMAQEVIWFIHPRFQGKGLMKELFVAVDRKMKLEGIDMYEINMPPTNHANKSMEKHGFKHVENKYVKRVI